MGGTYERVSHECSIQLLERQGNHYDLLLLKLWECYPLGIECHRRIVTSNMHSPIDVSHQDRHDGIAKSTCRII